MSVTTHDKEYIAFEKQFEKVTKQMDHSHLKNQDILQKRQRIQFLDYHDNMIILKILTLQK